MDLKEELGSEVDAILSLDWETREGRVVPEAESVSFENEAVTLDGTVLYADLAQSTTLVTLFPPQFAAEIYKCYLHCASEIIKHYGGVITAFDGDRVMAVYIGNRKNNDAVRSALAINHAVVKIINPRIIAQYPKSDYSVRHGVGIDTGSLLVAKTGIRGSNDLVWVGPAANYAAKLCSLRVGGFATWITNRVYCRLGEDLRITREKGMWEKASWTEYHGMLIYKSSWHWGAA